MKPSIPSPDEISKIVVQAAERDNPVLEVAIPTDAVVDLSLDLEEHKLSFRMQCLEHELKELRDKHGLRLTYAGRIFWLVVGWLACVVICIVLAGFKYKGFSLSDTVLVAFITSTTVNVVGLFVMVAKWMYPDGGVRTTEKLETDAAALKRGLEDK